MFRRSYKCLSGSLIEEDSDEPDVLGLISASSGIAKHRRNENRRNCFGDDACFVAHHHSADVIGVADGVGGWRNHGIDPSRFSHSMMSTCAQLVFGGHFKPYELRKLIADTYVAVKDGSALRKTNGYSGNGDALPDYIFGSSTICIAALERRASQIHTANLGDSGFLLFRNSKLVWRSAAQLHQSNIPFQIALLPEDQHINSIRDGPETADINSFDVRIGDCVLIGTDGLFDNLPVELIEEEMASLKSYERSEMQALSKTIVQKAKTFSLQSEFPAYFAQKLRRRGGKPDDITVVVAVVAQVGQEAVYAV